MGRIRRRKGNRQPVIVDKEIAILVYDGRIEGEILDATENGLGVMVASDSGLRPGQKIRIIYRRKMQMAKIARIEPRDDGDLVGIKLNA